MMLGTAKQQKKRKSVCRVDCFDVHIYNKLLEIEVNLTEQGFCQKNITDFTKWPTLSINSLPKKNHIRHLIQIMHTDTIPEDFELLKVTADVFTKTILKYTPKELHQE